MPKVSNQKPDKFAIAAALQEIAALMELKGGPFRFKAKAYNAGARSIQAVNNLETLVKEDLLTTLPRIGGALASQIKELSETGHSSVLDKLRQEFPPGILELSTVRGLSVGKIRQLSEELNINSIDELKAAAESGQLRNVKGFGAKTEQSLLKSLQLQEDKPVRRLHLHHAVSTGLQIVEYLHSIKGVEEVSFAGALRRCEETVETIEIVASGKKPAYVMSEFLKLASIVSSELTGDSSCVAHFVDGARVEVSVVPPVDFALTLFMKTGSPEHVEKVSKYALSQAKSRSRKLPRTEDEFYSRLGMQFIPPELREDNGEVEAAIEEKLPEDLITRRDVKGMVHCHTTYSDGKHSIMDMALAAEAMGMKYLTITDHSPTASYAGGLTVERLWRQWDEIDEVQSNVKIKLLRGTESDITAGGLLDYPDDILERFDVIVASIHARYKMDSAKMTQRIVSAMKVPVFKIWGHALGRLVQRRPPIECDVERILDVIAESEAAIEINGDPYRLDLEPRWIREARKRNIKFVISVDAHSTGAMNNVQYGVAMARRGWVRRGEVLNTLSAKAFAAAVRPV